MKKILLVAVTVLMATFILSTVSAFADDMKLKSVASIVKEIVMDQKVKSVEEVNPDKVGTPMLETLGDSVMEATLGNTMMHDKMDIQLGGDGSASLTAYHARIGYNYLSNYPDGILSKISADRQATGQIDRQTYGRGPGAGFGIGRGGMMRNGYSAYPGMMGGFANFGWGAVLICFLGFLFLVAVALLIAKLLASKHPKNAVEKPLDILKRRLANGEITHDEFEKLKAALE
ncbi:MAG: SHOCT domain-containing protein [Clostridia bacterium]